MESTVDKTETALVRNRFSVRCFGVLRKYADKDGFMEMDLSSGSIDVGTFKREMTKILIGQFPLEKQRIESIIASSVCVENNRILQMTDHIENRATGQSTLACLPPVCGG